MKHAIISFVLAIFALVVVAATATQVNDYENGNVLTAGELNSEFGNIYTTLNNLDFDNFAPGTLLPPTIIDSIIAGLGLTQNPTTGALDVNVDGTSLDITLDVVSVKDDGITAAKIATNAVGTAEIANNAVTSAKIPNNAIGSTEIADLAVTSAKFADGSITNAKLGTGSVTSVKILDGSVTKAKQEDASVVTNDGSAGNVVYSSSTSGTLSSNFAGDGVGFLVPQAQIDTTGRPVMVMMGPRFGGGTSYLRCVNVGGSASNDVTVRLEIDSGSGFTEVARWGFDFGAQVSGGGFQNLHDFSRPFIYVDGRAPTNNIKYRYLVFSTNNPSLADLCTYSNLSTIVFEL